MATNLVSLAMKFLTPELMLKMASALGLDKGLAQKAIGAAIPAILAGLVGRAGKPDGAKSIADAIGRQEPGLLGNLAGMLGGSGQSSLMNGGTAALTSLLGSSALGGLTGALAKFAGVGEGPAKGLLGMLAPVVLGSVGQEQKAQKLDAAGLAGLLSAQKDHIANALPGDFAKLLGGTGLLDAVKGSLKNGGATTVTAAAAPSAPRRVDTPARVGAAPARPGALAAPAAPWWRLPLIAAVALGLGWTLFGTTPPSTITAPQSPAAQKILVDGTDVGGLATGAIDSVRGALGGIRDGATAQSALPKLQEAGGQLDKVTALAAKLSPEMRKALATTVAAGNSTLAPLFNTVLAIPGVSAIVKPAIDAVRAKLDVLSKA